MAVAATRPVAFLSLRVADAVEWLRVDCRLVFDNGSSSPSNKLRDVGRDKSNITTKPYINHMDGWSCYLSSIAHRPWHMAHSHKIHLIAFNQRAGKLSRWKSDSTDLYLVLACLH